jgi:RNA polymerase sigma-70 factor (ECF subfamily)
MQLFVTSRIIPCLSVGAVLWFAAPAMKSLDDATLLQAVARRDETAFAELYDRMARPVFSLVVRVLRSRAEAEEVLQEAFWQVWERAPDYRAELGSAFCWIVTIARRKAIDRLRANARHLKRIEEARDLRNDDDLVEPAGLKSLAAGERETAVRRALGRLGLEERRAIALAFFDGLTHEEIATVLRAPVGTIKARIRRGILKLKPALARVRQAETP